MLTEEQKEQIESEERYRAFEEALAVAALRRRLEFIEHQYKQIHETGEVSIQTERAGHRIKIRWHFKESAPARYELVGFKKTGGGFFPDKWDEKSNGVLVIHSSRSGELMEPLKEGEAYFYTFILRPWSQGEGDLKYLIARFQVNVATADETEAIEAAIRRIESRKQTDPIRESMAQVLKSVGLSLEYRNALDEMEKTLIQQIKEKKLPKEEEERKIADIHEAIAEQRDKF